MISIGELLLSYINVNIIFLENLHQRICKLLHNISR